MSIPFLHPKKALKSDIFKHSKKLLFSLPVGRQNPRAPLPVHSNFDAHLLGGHSSQARHKKYRFTFRKTLPMLALHPTGHVKHRKVKIRLFLTSHLLGVNQSRWRHGRPS